MALIKLGSNSGNRVVLLTVSMVALAGLVVGAASYVRTQKLSSSYDHAMKSELEQKGLAYGQTSQALINLIASSSPSTFQAVLARAIADPAGVLTTFHSNQAGHFQDTPIGYQAWVRDKNNGAGYTFLFRVDVPGQRVPAGESSIASLVSNTAVSGEPASLTNEPDKDLHYSFVVHVNDQTDMIVIATLDASQEFAFLAAQQDSALRDAIFFSIGSVVFVSLVGGALSFLVSRTLTNRKRAEDALRESELRYRTLASLAPVGIFRTDADGSNLYSNERTLEALGVTTDPSDAGGWMSRLHPEDKDRVIAEWNEARAQGRPFKSQGRFLRPDGSVVWVLSQIAAERNLHGETIGYVGTITDITEQKHMEERLAEQARIDKLTGMLNHAAIVEELQHLLSSSDCNGCAVAMIDIDGMKAVNDTYGHQMGDLTLQIIAGVLQRNGAIVGRYGGDEFTAVLPGAGREEAERYREEVRAALSATKITDPDTRAQVPLSVTIGIAIYPEEAETIVDLIKLADSAMYAQRRERPILPTSHPRRSTADDQAARMVGEIVPLLTSPGDTQSKLHFVVHRLLIGLGQDAVTIVLFAQEPGGAALSATVARVDEEVVRDWDEEQSKEGPPSALRSLLENVKRPFIMDDLATDERLSAAQRTLLGKAGLQSGLVVPMIWQGQTLGALAVGSQKAGAYSPSDARLLNTVCAQVTAVVRMNAVVEELDATSAQLMREQEDTVMLLAAAAEAHDATTGQHLQRMRYVAEALALELGHSAADARDIGLAAALHDIGKLFVPERVLRSSRALAGEDWEIMKRHTTLGQQFLNGHNGFELAALIARHHHERWDGAGYPDRLAGDQIPEAAAIVMVADTFDAMTNERRYQQAASVQAAVDEIAACAGTQFSARVAQALLLLHERGKLVVEDEAERAA
jgi:diguanylate cyclase (GGDEF)-like protein/PAS domain S-box-containing protein